MRHQYASVRGRGTKAVVTTSEADVLGRGGEGFTDNVRRGVRPVVYCEYYTSANTSQFLHCQF